MGRVEPLRPVSVLPSKLSGLICRETVYQASEKCWVGSPFLKFLPLKTSCCLGGHLPIGFFKGKHCALSTFYFPCSNRLTWDAGSCWELINICWCQVFNHFGNKNWWERKISQEPKWCLINDSISGFGSACKQGGCVQGMPAHPSSYCSLTKPAATSSNQSPLNEFQEVYFVFWWHILKVQKSCFCCSKRFSSFNMMWRGTWPRTQADQLLSLIIDFFDAFQPILTESRSVIGFPRSSLHVS